MADQIKPALTAEQWAVGGFRRNGKRIHLTMGGSPLWFAGGDDLMLAWEEDFPALIALANAALPDDDPRKITRERIDALRSCVETYNTDFQRLVRSAGREPYDSPTATIAREAIAALEALLPPDKWAAYNKACADLPNQRL